MLKKGFLFLLLASFAMVSCDPTPIAEANFEFDESLQWKKSEPAVLKLDIRENAEPCELYLDVRYTTLFPFDKLELHIKEISEHGVVVPRDVTVEIKNQNGFVGDISGDIERELDSNKQYEDHGVYTYEISFNHPVDVLLGIMELRLRAVPKAKKS
ncbi:MAG: GldH lipoprotein [Bacteroidota bacterium]|jgi:gliding motility-associated lipoprotein GldH